MFQITTDYGECSFCGSTATPAFVNGAEDALGRQQRVCAGCHAEMSVHVEFVPIERYEGERARANTAAAESAQRTIEFDAERKQLTEATAKLERAEADVERLRQELATSQSALVAERKRADEAEQGIASLTAYRRIFGDAQTQKTSETRKKVAA